MTHITQHTTQLHNVSHSQVVSVAPCGVRIFPCVLYECTASIQGHGVAQLIEVPHYKPEGPRVRFPMVSLEYFIDIILLAALWPWG